MFGLNLDGRLDRRDELLLAVIAVLVPLLVLAAVGA
jgi:hypothetical protein